MSRKPEAPKEPDHWLVRPDTIRKIWIGSLTVLAILVVLDFVIEKHPHTEAEKLPAFASWYGFFGCVILVFGSKAIGVFLKRKDTYYDD